jgi:hypothetical protein
MCKIVIIIVLSPTWSRSCKHFVAKLGTAGIFYRGRKIMRDMTDREKEREKMIKRDRQTERESVREKVRKIETERE